MNTTCQCKPITKIAMVAENQQDVMSCITIAAALRKVGMMVHTPLNYSSVKRQLRKVSETDSFYLVVIDGDKASFRYLNTPVKVDIPVSDLVELIMDLESDDDPRLDITNQLLIDHYEFKTGAKPSWAT